MIESIDNPEIILNYFTNCISNYNLVVEREGSHLFLKNQNGQLDLYMEWGALECDLYLNNQNDRFSLKTIPKYGFDSDFNITINKPESYIYIIENFLHDTLLNGNFGWVTKYRLNKEKSRALLKRVYDLPNDDPIKVKYFLNDITWKNDLIEKFPELK